MCNKTFPLHAGVVVNTVEAFFFSNKRSRSLNVYNQAFQSFRYLPLPGFFRDADAGCHARLLSNLRLRRGAADLTGRRQLHGPGPRERHAATFVAALEKVVASLPSHRLRHEPLSAIVRCLFRKQVQIDVLRASVLRLLVTACSIYPSLPASTSSSVV